MLWSAPTIAFSLSTGYATALNFAYLAYLFVGDRFTPTVGQRVFSLSIRRTSDEGRPSTRQAFLRESPLACLLTLNLVSPATVSDGNVDGPAVAWAVVVLVIALAWGAAAVVSLWASGGRRTPHDRLSGTVPVRVHGAQA